MADNYANVQPSMAGPALRHYTVTPSDTVALDPRPRALYVNSDGDLALELPGDSAPIVYSVVAGQVLPIRPVRIHATGTTATIIAWD
jgi:hypothetical protein